MGAPLAEAPIVLPLAAVVGQGKGAAVWLVVEGKLKRQPVVVKQFREDGAVLEIGEKGGLKGGEMVVVVGANRLAEGQAVKAQIAAESAR